MDEFDKLLVTIDRDELKSYLLSLRTPCYESSIMKIAFPDFGIAGADPLSLYRKHFVLFHMLYLLQDEFHSENKYLFIHFMRTFLADYPLPGKCRHYDEHAGGFCGADCAGNHCDFHSERTGDNELGELSDRYFYLDGKNFHKLDENTAGAFMEGTWELLAHYGDFKKSFAVLDLPESADVNMVKRKFRILAKKYHPDHGEKSHEKFNEINGAYRLLMKMLPKNGLDG